MKEIAFLEDVRVDERKLRRRVERKIRDVLGEDQFGVRRGKRNGEAIGMLRIISERTLEVCDELCACCIDCVKWTKLVQTPNEAGIE